MQDQKKKRQICARHRYEVEVGVRSIEENGAKLADIAICTLQHVIQDELANRAKMVESCCQITGPRKSLG